MSEEYTPKQREVLRDLLEVNRMFDQWESLGRMSRHTFFGLDGSMEQTVAEIYVNNNLPSYEALRKSLRESLQNARDLGLSDHPDVKKYSHMLTAA